MSVTQMRRLACNKGPTPANIVLGGNWGVGAALSITAGSNDQRGSFVVSVGSAPGVGPEWQIIFRDDAWPNAPFAVVTVADLGAVALLSPPIWTATPTTLTAIQGGTPPAGASLFYSYIVMG